ncbi:MAG: sulfatase, partial [Acidobacteria bacterium]
MSQRDELALRMTRRRAGIGIPALASLLTFDGYAAEPRDPKTGGLVGLPHFPPKAKRVIFLHQSGAPSQMELFDYKPQLEKLQGTELPATVRMGQRIIGMTSGQASFPVAASTFKFKQAGKSGAWISELLPHHTKIVDDIAIIKTANTEAINHDPAITFIQTGSQQPGRPSMGAWVS